VRIHVFQHVPFEGIGSIQQWADSAGASLATTRLFEPGPMPFLADFDWLIVMGGPMSVNDESRFAWLQTEKRLIASAVRTGKTVLGICLGGQLIASALGARVFPSAQREIGWFPVRRTARADSAIASLFGNQTEVFHWHGETFNLPAGAAGFLESDACGNQAFQIGRRVLGLQFHLETTPQGAASLFDHSRQDLAPGPFVQSETQILSRPERFLGINRLMDSILDELASQERRRVAVEYRSPEIETLNRQAERLRAELSSVYRSRSWRLAVLIRHLVKPRPLPALRALLAFARRPLLLLICLRRRVRLRRVLPGFSWRPGIDIVDRLGVQFAHHRSGWTCAVDALSPLHWRNGLGIDTFVESTFAGHNPPSAAHVRPWVGICHVPTVIPEWLPDIFRHMFFPYYSQGVAWQIALEHCVGLFALSEAHAEELRKATGLTVCRLMHPTEVPPRQWTLEGFLASRRRKVIQVGWWLRNMHAIYQAPFRGYEKVLLELTGQGHVQEYFSREEEYLLRRGQFKTEMLETVTRVPYVSNEEYDRLLSESIVFLDLYGSSANNAIIECIARGTPLLVNRLPAVEEYLGADYPLFYSSHEEAAEKAADIDLLQEAHLRLQAPDTRSRICAQNFLKSFVSSSIYQEAARASA
jgi:GMP synthase-like glutamine amidotransferase